MLRTYSDHIHTF